MGTVRIQRLMPNEVPTAAVLDCLSEIVLVLSQDFSKLCRMNQCTGVLTGYVDALSDGLDNWMEAIVDSQSHARLQNIFLQLKDPSVTALPELCIDLRSVVGTPVQVRVHSILASPDQWFLIAVHAPNSDAADEILRQAQARFRSIVDSLSINLVMKDLQGRVIYANQQFLEFHQWKLADVLGKTDQQLFPIALARKFLDDDRSVLETGRVLHQFEENRRADGSSYWAEVIKGPLLDADGQIAGVQVLFWDATERKLTEQALQVERHLLHMLLENVPDSIYFKDTASRFTRVSRSMIEKFGLTDGAELLGKTDADIFTTEHASRARQDEVEIMHSQRPMIGIVERETWADRPDSWSSTTKLPLRDPDGKVAGTFGISRDITALIKVEQEIREARDLANQANLAKSEFLANMSHEIRTPMNGIIGMTELLSHTRLTDAQRSFVTMIEQSAQSLLRIINDILDFSKIEAGKLDLELTSFDLRACVGNSAKSLATRAAQNGTELILRISREIPDRLMGDEIRLRQVLVNLISNAVKFTRAGEITVRVSLADGPPAAELYSLHFSVADTGIGIPKEKQTKIFEAFSQADVSTTRQYGGTGLGLSIASQLVQLMDGRIWLESEPGVGSVFHFTGRFAPSTDLQAEQIETTSVEHLPVLIVDDNPTSRSLLANSLARRGMIARETDSPEQAAQIVELYVRETPGPIVLLVDQLMPGIDPLQMISDLKAKCDGRQLITILLTTAAHPITEQQMERFGIHGLLHKPTLPQEVCSSIQRALHPTQEQLPGLVSGSEPPASTASRVKLRLLLAEDGAVNRAVFLGLLNSQGHEVTCVEDGEAAVEAWQEFHFDAIFMDVQMPVLDGLEATQRIRQLEPDGDHIPIVAITAGAMFEDQQRCFQAGMDDYLSKPIDVKQLTSVLNTLVLHAEGKTEQWQEVQELPDTALVNPQNHGCLNLDAPLAKVKCTPSQQRELVQTLRDETMRRMDEMVSAFESVDDKLLVRASHSLKSAAALFEARQVSDISGKIEAAARRGDTQTAQSLLGQLQEATRVMLMQIEDWLGR